MKSKNTRPLICHFLIDHRIGGPHNYLLSCIKINKAHTDNIIFTCGKSTLNGSHSLINLRVLNRYLYPIEVLLNIFLILIIVGFLLTKRKIIIHCHGIHNVAPLFVSRMLKIPTILLIHENMPELRVFSRLTRFLLHFKNTKIISVSKKGLIEYSIKNGEVVYSPVDTDFWKAQEYTFISPKWCLNSSDSIIKILFIGNINPVKGIDLLLESLSRVSFPLTLLIIGSKIKSHINYYEKLLTLIEFLKKNNSNIKISFLGWQTSEEIRELLSQADIFVLTSKSEGCPIALLEAISVGCVPFVTNVGDVKEFIQPILIESLSTDITIEAVSNGLATLINKLNEMTCEEKVKVKIKFRELAMQQFESKIVANKILNFYYEVLNK